MAGESNRIRVGTIAVGNVTGAGGTRDSAVTRLGRPVGNAVQAVRDQ